jgi:3-deoxy-D-manno-octulosonate 8-phosphate phosphatase (KDO 8-P phosphatase)
MEIPADLRRRAKGVRLLVLDVDGVLTDGTLYYGAGGEELKAFHIQDGLGIKMLQASGVEVAIITGRASQALRLRAEDLGIRHVRQGVQRKLAAYHELLRALDLEQSQTACMGDDLPDLPMLDRCALAATVPDAPEAVRSRVHYVTRRPGGRGAVRELCELILDAQDQLQSQLATYLDEERRT